MSSSSLVRRIGLLTGTFDPVHAGHIALAREAIGAAGLDEVWLVVNPRRTNSPVENKTGVLSYGHRMAMAKLAAMRESGVLVYKGELRDQPHSVSTFAKFATLYPNLEFVFILGMDAIARLDGWDDVESVVETTSFVAATRPNIAKDSIDGLRYRLGPLGPKLKVQSFDFEGYGEVSSTVARRALASGDSPNWLSKEVYAYIRRNNLYI